MRDERMVIWSTHKTLVGSVVIAALMLVGVSLLSQRNIEAAIENSKRVTTIVTSIDAIDYFYSVLLDAESGQRGFLLTGEERYLQPYLKALSQLPALLGDIEKEHLRMGRSLGWEENKMNRLLHLKLADMGRTIELRRQGELAAATALVLTDEGRLIMDQLRDALQRLRSADRIYLQQKDSQFIDSTRETRFTSTLLFMLVIMITIVGFLLLSRELKRRELLVIEAESARREQLKTSELLKRRSREIVDSVNRQKAILNTVVDGIITINEFGIVESFNPAAERLFGYRAEDVIGENVKMLMPSPYRDEHDDYLQHYREGGEAHIIGIGREVVGQCSDGSTFPMELAVGRMEIEGRAMYTGIVRDVSERKQAERELTETTERLRQQSNALSDSASRQQAILNTVVDAIITINQFGIIESYNTAAERTFGYSRDEVLGKNVNILMPNPYHDAHDVYLERYRSTGEAHIIGIGREVEGRRKDGSTFPLELSVGEMLINGEPMYTGITRDVSERYAAQKLIKDSTKRLEVAAEAAGFGVWDYDVVHNELIWDDRMFCIYGIEAKNFSGAYDAWSSALSPDSMEEAQEALQAAIRGEREFRTEFSIIWPNGEEHTIEAFGSVLRNAQGEAQRMIGVNIDITERKKVDRMKNEFISTVSHELRTPLTSIKGSLGLIRSGVTGEMPPKLGTMLDIAYNNSDRLVRLINDILDIEKIEAGKMNFKMVNLDLVALIEEAVDANQGYAKEHNVTFKITYFGGEQKIHADHDRLIQALTNLLSNAAKFSPDRGVVEVGLVRDGQILRVEVSDHGHGIPAAFHNKIFGKFSQADSSDTRQKGGTGLGLSITKAIIEHHGGIIGFKSEEGVGTTFWFELPACKDDLIEDHEDDLLSVPLDGDAPTILICEDDVDIARVLRGILNRSGFHADVAHSSAEALQMLAQRDYQAMTLDLVLKDGHGMDLLKTLRQESRNADIPVIVVSALADAVAHQYRRGENMTVSSWQKKPIDSSRLIASLQGVMQGSDSEGERILHVEDDPDIRKVVAALIGEQVEVIAAATLDSATKLIQQFTFDLVVLDLTLPDGSGEEFLGCLANSRNRTTPVVVFSAREMNVMDGRGVDAALMKSKTSNELLLTTLRAALSPRGLLNNSLDLSEKE